jgi:phosphocarrier protein HPr
MLEKEVEVVNRAGIHTRPASAIVKLTSKFKSEVQIVRDGFGINGKSIIGVMTLAAEQGSVLTLQIDGSDEEECFNALDELFKSGFGEEI